MMEVDTFTEIIRGGEAICSAPTMRREVDVDYRQTVGKKISHILAPYVDAETCRVGSAPGHSMGGAAPA